MSASDIVGIKSFDTGEIEPSTGFPKLRCEPLTRGEADDLRDAVEKEAVLRVAHMPDETAALRTMFNAWLRLKELGWREAMYCPKDGSHFKAIEAGNTGIHDCNYTGDWPKGSWWIYDGDGDVWPSRPILFCPYSEAEAKEEKR